MATSNRGAPTTTVTAVDSEAPDCIPPPSQAAPHDREDGTPTFVPAGGGKAMRLFGMLTPGLL
ncbi:hypothetical protein GCM10022402_49700 [Salinactinospora qingdaonensis]|uniref:Uncharacterized protein n=1 Tax=Salinactinospora qingdaonensis TaxID=702744 RepID=A0ABP7GJW7_9ACTN